MYDLLVVSTGSSIKKYREELKELSEYIPILAWGHAFYYLFTELNVVPKYWGYVDITSIEDSLNAIQAHREALDTTLIRFHPVVTVSLAEQMRHLGFPRGIRTEKQYGKHLKKVMDVSQYVTLRSIKTHSTKICPGFSNNTKNRETKSIPYVFSHTDVVIRPISDKLIGCIIPLLAKSKFKTIYIIGFDGKGLRFHRTDSTPNNIIAIEKDRQVYFKKYLEFSRLNITSITPSEYTNINDYVPYRNINEVIADYKHGDIDTKV